MQNLDIYRAVRLVPQEARKQITAGRLKGKTDINPMWRIKVLTEQFGPCGIGWYYTIDKQWLEPGSDEQVCAFCNISLYIKLDGEWSKPIHGTGGSALIAKEGKGLYTSDECYKMALTDALSVACKALGVGAEIYWDKDQTKYDEQQQQLTQTNAEQRKPMQTNVNKQKPTKKTVSKEQMAQIMAIVDGDVNTVKQILRENGFEDSTLSRAGCDNNDFRALIDAANATILTAVPLPWE